MRMVKNLLSLFWSLTRRGERNDPSRGWQGTAPKLVIDLTASTLCGVRSGEPVHHLQFLGPCEHFMPIGMIDEDETGWWWINRSYSLAYHSLGLTVWFEHDMSIDSFQLVVDSSEEPEGTEPFVGCLQWEGREFVVSDFADCDRVAKVFGEPSRLTEPSEAEKQAFEGQQWKKYFQYEHANVMFEFNDTTGSTTGLWVGHKLNQH